MMVWVEIAPPEMAYSVSAASRMPDPWRRRSMRRNHHFYIDGRAGAVGPYPFGQSAGLGVVAPEPVSTSVVPTDPDVRRSPNAIFIADRTRIHFTSYRNVDVGAVRVHRGART